MGAIAKTLREQLQNLVNTITTTLDDSAKTRTETLAEIEKLNAALQDNVADTREVLKVLDEFGTSIWEISEHSTNQLNTVEEKVDYLADLSTIGTHFCEVCGAECDDSITCDDLTFCSDECRDEYLSAMDEDTDENEE